MDTLRLDLKYAIRALSSRPGFSTLAVVTLALGIGVNAVAFSALNGLLFKPAAIPGVESLGWVLGRAGRGGSTSVSYDEYRHYAGHARTFEAIAAEGRLPFSFQHEGGAQQVWALVVSSNYLPMLSVRPVRGRVLDPADLTASEVGAVVSHRFWTNRLGGGDGVAGRTLTLNGRNVSIVGVLPDSFQGPGGLFEPDVWLPIERLDALNVQPGLLDGSDRWLTLIGRLAPGISAAQAQADLDGLSARLAADFPATHAGRSVWFARMRDGHPDVRGLAPVMWIALGVVGLVLLIACFNVAGLLLARASERQREIGVRSALGASRVRVLRQLVTEATVLAAISGVAALVVASWSGELLATFSLPAPIPQRLHMGTDLRLVGFVAAMVAVAGLLPALIPALQATRADLLRSLRSDTSGAGSRSRARSAFVVAQVAGSTLFLAAALLFVRSYWNGATTNPGFDAEHVLAMELRPATFGYDATRSRALVEALVDRVRGLPGVTAAAVADRVPFYVGFPRERPLAASDSDCSDPQCRTATVYQVGPGHFAALGVRLRAGREFHERDAPDSGVIVSEATAARLWPGREAVGRSLRMGPDGPHVPVVGVAADFIHRGFDEPPRSYVYRRLGPEAYEGGVTLLARAAGDPRGLAASVQAQLSALDPAMPPAAVRTMAQRMELPLWPARTLAGFFLICGVLSVTLATVGLFGVTYYAVSQRTREFGIRVALGATPHAVMRLVLRDGLRLALPGIAVGIAAVLAAGRVAASALLGVSPYDPVSFVTAAALQILVALLACALPARRATAADPMRALRHD